MTNWLMTIDRPPVAAVREVAAEERQRQRGQRLDESEQAQRQRVVGQQIDLVPDDDGQSRSSRTTP